MEHLHLREINGDVIIDSPASVLALIYISSCPHCKDAYDEMNKVLSHTKCNFYLIDGNSEPLAQKLTNRVPTIIGFKNHTKVGTLTGPINHQSIYEFWSKILNLQPKNSIPVQNNIHVQNNSHANNIKTQDSRPAVDTSPQLSQNYNGFPYKPFVL